MILQCPSRNDFLRAGISLSDCLAFEQAWGFMLEADQAALLRKMGKLAPEHEPVLEPKREILHLKFPLSGSFEPD
jgi:hypothetical protein